MPKAPEYEDGTLVLSKKGKVVARFPTFGYILNIYWSSGERFVAINNRRANSGDWLWVISLADSKVLKVPDDLAEGLGKKELGQPNGNDDPKEFKDKFPQCEGDGVHHVYLFARGWQSPTELSVFHEFRCFNFDRWIEVEKVYRVEHELKLVTQSIETRDETTRD